MHAQPLAMADVDVVNERKVVQLEDLTKEETERVLAQAGFTVGEKQARQFVVMVICEQTSSRTKRCSLT